MLIRISMIAAASMLVAQGAIGQGTGHIEFRLDQMPSTSELRAMQLDPIAASKILDRARAIQSSDTVSPPTSGLRLGVDDRGVVVPVYASNAPKGSIVLSPDLVDVLKSSPNSIYIFPGLLPPQLRIGLSDPTVQQTIDITNAPPSVQALIPDHNAVLSCAKAQKPFAEKLGNLEEFGSLDVGWREIASNFDQQCLNPVSAAQPQPLPIDRIVILFDENLRPVCTGYHLQSDLFVTARHCFSDQNHRIKKMAIAAQPGSPYFDITEPITSLFDGTMNSGPRDIAVVKAIGLPADIASRSRGVVASGVKENSEALMIGLFSLANGGQASGVVDWQKSLRYTRVAGACRVLKVKSGPDGVGCIEHSCQSVRGFSGAPIFVRVGADWQVAGFQSGATTYDAAQKCGFTVSKLSLGSLGNIATMFPTSLNGGNQ